MLPLNFLNQVHTPLHLFQILLSLLLLFLLLNFIPNIPNESSLWPSQTESDPEVSEWFGILVLKIKDCLNS